MHFSSRREIIFLWIWTDKVTKFAGQYDGGLVKLGWLLQPPTEG